eukprot:Nk52_evm1s2596 gene=Nk52_evmTU1s2596
MLSEHQRNLVFTSWPSNLLSTVIAIEEFLSKKSTAQGSKQDYSDLISQVNRELELSNGRVIKSLQEELKGFVDVNGELPLSMYFIFNSATLVCSFDEAERKWRFRYPRSHYFCVKFSAGIFYVFDSLAKSSINHQIYVDKLKELLDRILSNSEDKLPQDNRNRDVATNPYKSYRRVLATFNQGDGSSCGLLVCLFVAYDTYSAAFGLPDNEAHKWQEHWSDPDFVDYLRLTFASKLSKHLSSQRVEMYSTIQLGSAIYLFDQLLNISSFSKRFRSASEYCEYMEHQLSCLKLLYEWGCSEESSQYLVPLKSHLYVLSNPSDFYSNCSAGAEKRCQSLKADLFEKLPNLGAQFRRCIPQGSDNNEDENEDASKGSRIEQNENEDENKENVNCATYYGKLRKRIRKSSEDEEKDISLSQFPYDEVDDISGLPEFKGFKSVPAKPGTNSDESVLSYWNVIAQNSKNEYQNNFSQAAKHILLCLLNEDRYSREICQSSTASWSSGWVSDEVINMSRELIMGSRKRRKHVYVLNTFFTNVKRQRTIDKQLKDVLSALKNGIKPLLLIPINENELHWLLWVVDYQKCEFGVYDSYGKTDEEVEQLFKKHHVKKLLKLNGTWECKTKIKSALQKNARSCGIYTILFALKLSGIDPDKVLGDLSSWNDNFVEACRRKIACWLRNGLNIKEDLHGKLAPFTDINSKSAVSANKYSPAKQHDHGKKRRLA